MTVIKAGLVVAAVLLVAGKIDAVEITPSAESAWPLVFLTLVEDGLAKPTHITNADDGSDRLFVTEREGRVMIIKNGSLLSTPFLDISSRVTDAPGDRGLCSIAFPQGYSGKGYFYVTYTDLNGDSQVSRFELTADPDVADPDSEEIVMTVEQQGVGHNVGQLAIGPDGYLYIGSGDGGPAGDPENDAQNPANLVGKILRIDVESGEVPYDVPATNPFTQTIGYQDEIWAMGFRNPWRFSFDRGTGDLYLTDVGQSLYEEVDYQPASSSGGENYGWNILEGFHCYKTPSCDTTGLTLPVWEYNHNEGCAVIGGFVYRGPSYPEMEGVYFYADYCHGKIYGLRQTNDTWDSRLLYNAAFLTTSFGEDEAGELYITDYLGGGIYRIGVPNFPTDYSSPLPIVLKD